MDQANTATVAKTSRIATGGQKAFLFGSRGLDFLLIGGLSLILWIPIYFLQGTFDGLEKAVLALPGIAFVLAYWVNYPHFMASYKLAYFQDKQFILSNWFQLIAVPALLLLCIILGLIFYHSPIRDSGVIASFNALFDTLGLRTRFGQHPNLGAELLGHLIVLMYFTVGWHYAKQTFGCMMVYAKLDNYPLTNLERNLIRYSLLSTWWLTWLYSNCAPGSYPFYNLTIYRLDLPYIWFQASYVLVALMFATLITLLSYKYVSQQVKPSWNFLIPMIALLTWHIPLAGQPQYFYLIAFFHSLQYFPFVAKVERSRYAKAARARPYLRLSLFFGIMCLLGYLCFDYLPNGLDRLSATPTELGVSFFLIAFLAFINIHHYFIDNVLWRFKNPEVKELLFH